MLDENLIATLEQSLRQTRNAQNRLMGRLREAESDVELLRIEINALENSAAQTEKAIDSLLVATRTGSRTMNFGSSMQIDSVTSAQGTAKERNGQGVHNQELSSRSYRRDNSVAYLNPNRGVPSINNDFEPVSNRFNDRTITQACTLFYVKRECPCMSTNFTTF